MGNSFHVSEKLSSQMSILLDMPDVQSPDCKMFTERPGTPHSILKTRRNSDMDREAPSPVDSRYLGDSDDELMDTASNHTHYSDANKHLRFTIPTASESGSTPSPPPASNVDSPHVQRAKEMDKSASALQEKEMDVSVDSFVTTTSHAMTETNPFESPPKKLATEESAKSKKSFKDTVRARRSFSISVNSSLSDDPNTSIESIADIPVTLINPRYSGDKHRKQPSETSEHQYDIEQRDSSVERSVTETNVIVTVTGVKETEITKERRELPKTPKGRRGIRAASESTPLVNRSRPTAPERVDSPVVTLRSSRDTRSRSRTPEISPRTSPLAPIPEQPRQETESEPHAERTTLFVPRQLRSRSRTPERLDKGVFESSKLEAITESPTKSFSTESLTKSSNTGSSGSSTSPSSRRSLRSRSHTPEIEVVHELVLKQTPRSLRSHSKTPEKLMSPRVESSARAKKSLSRKAFENILIAKAKQADLELETESPEEKPEVAIECTPMKSFKQVRNLMDVTLSPIVNKSVLQSSTDSTISETAEKESKSDKSTFELDLKPLPAFTTLHETRIEKSVLHSYESSVGDTSVSLREEKVVIQKSESVLKPLPAFTLNETEFNKSVLHSYESSVAEESSNQEDKNVTETDKNISKPFADFVQMIQTDFEKSVLHSAQSSIGEISQFKDYSKISQEPSSLITNDSDVEMEENVAQERAEQKEKKKIGEIEREIDEIQDMSEEEPDISDLSASDEENEAEEESENSSPSESSSSSEEANEENEEVISIEDSDDSRDKLQIDEQSKDSSEENNIEVVEIEEKETEAKDKETDIKDNEAEVKDKFDSQNITQIESSNDPLNQANFSLTFMTDDNSLVESDKSDINLNYSGESDKVNTSDETPDEQMETVPVPAAVQIEISPPVDDIDGPSHIDIVPTEIDTKITEPEQKTTRAEAKDIKPIESVKEAEKVSEATEKVPEVVQKEPKATEEVSMVIEKAPKVAERVPKDAEKEVKISEKTEMSQKVTEVAATEPKAISEEVPMVVEEELKVTEKKKEVIEKVQEVTKKVPKVIEEVPMVTEESPKSTGKALKDTKKVTESSQKAPEGTEKASDITEKVEETTEKEAERPTRTRKRAKSTTSNKSTTEPEVDATIRTPVTRKRTQSIASNKSIDTEPKTSETSKTVPTTPSRRRAKTPTSAEVRKIITRRVSREMSGKSDESNVLDESVTITTPKRRSTRSRSKNFDDNESVASESSFGSKGSEDAGDRAVKKGRKPTLVTKPELPVIPEVISEEASKLDAGNVINEYSSARRLTRHQKAVLESWLEPTASPRRRTSTASRTSVTSRSVASEVDDDDASSTHSAAFDVQPIDRISLLNKTDFEGIPDIDELQSNLSPESLASDASKQRRSRLRRAASETKALPRPAKINRRVSVDVVNSPDRGSPTGAESPARGRRKSFNRACEALHTPKGRRTSIDVTKGDGESAPESPPASESEAPAPAAAPARRTRRASSAISNTSQANSETGKRSRKTAVDENKETKKK